MSLRNTAIRYKPSSPILQIGELYTERKLLGNNVRSLVLKHFRYNESPVAMKATYYGKEMPVYGTSRCLRGLLWGSKSVFGRDCPVLSPIFVLVLQRLMRTQIKWSFFSAC